MLKPKSVRQIEAEQKLFFSPPAVRTTRKKGEAYRLLADCHLAQGRVAEALSAADSTLQVMRDIGDDRSEAAGFCRPRMTDGALLRRPSMPRGGGVLPPPEWCQ